MAAENHEDELKLPDIKGWFSNWGKKSDEKPHAEHKPHAKAHEKAPSDDEEISIDWSRIKSFFTGMFSGAKKTASQDKEDSIDWQSLKSFAVRNATLLILIALLVMQFVPNDGMWPWGGVWMRAQGKDLPITNDWARDTVHNSIRSQLRGSIADQYPHLPDANKNTLVEEQLQQILSQQQASVDTQIEATAGYFRSRFQYEEGGRSYPYMPDIDPYVYVRYAKNYLAHGYIGDEMTADGRQIDNHQFAPLGNEITGKTLHPYVLAYIHKIASVLSPGIPLFQSTAYMPLIFMLLAMIPAFFIARRYGGNLAGVIAATALIVHPALTGRTVWGHADTDSYVIFFPLMIVWLFLESYDQKEQWKRLGLGALAGFFVGMFAFSWGGWWYIFDFIIGVIALHFAWRLYQHRKHITAYLKGEETKTILMAVGAFILAAGLFVTLFASFESFWSAPTSPLRFRVFKAAAHATLWPNVYTTVAELNPISVQGVINQFGTLPMLLAALGAFGSMFLPNKSGKKDVRFGILLILWFLATLYASTQGIRFVMLMVPAYALAFGTFWGIIDGPVAVWAKKHLSIPRVATTLIIIAITLFFLMGPVRGSYGQGRGDIPIINDAWWTSLTAIKDNSSSDAIITSWWDFGHHFKYIADRPVTFDGGSQNTPIAHWVGKLLLTDDEKLSAGILRMLDCGSNMAFNKTAEVERNPTKAVALLYLIVKQDRADAKKTLLSKGFSDGQADAVLEYSHCDAPEGFLITSDDMVGKSGVWGHFGSWDFLRADLWNNVRHMGSAQAIEYLQREYNMSAAMAESSYFEAKSILNEGEANTWIAPWPSFATGVSGCQVVNTTTIQCDNGLVVDGDNVLIRTAQGQGTPQGLAYIDKRGKYKYLNISNSTTNVEAAMWPTKDGYASFFAAAPMARSMFARLFYMEGHDLRYFDHFRTEREITGNTIIVWKVDWNGSTQNIMNSVRKPSNVSEGVEVEVDYIGWVDGGTVFDSSIENWQAQGVTSNTPIPSTGTRPITYVVGARNVIPGFESRLMNATVGETRTIQIPAEEAYGTDPSTHPLANRTLHFRVKIRDLRVA